MSMDEVLPGLWIGDLPAALDAELLKENKIGSVLTAMRGSCSINGAFVHNQINIDDSEEEDLLSLLPSCISWIDSELAKGRGVLVHCQAGYSRSPSIIAAYLMFVKEIPLETALEIIRTARPAVGPNDGFLAQLTLFQEASYKLSRWNKSTRMFYLDRAAREIMNGEGRDLPLHMLAKFPRSPSDSGPATPGFPKRRIRCRLCRQELASREHLMHTNTSVSSSPLTSRRPSLGEYFPISPQSRRNSASNSIRPTGITSEEIDLDQGDHQSAPPSILLGLSIRKHSQTGEESKRPIATLQKDAMGHSTSALDSEDDDTEEDEIRVIRPPIRSAKIPTRRQSSNLMMTPIKQKDVTQEFNRFQSPPLLPNSTCSGYFLEPMKWMEPFLGDGMMAGKIICPNNKCGAKLGNFDWAGVMCSCREWVTPGFCLARSKVDEIV